tara:strand:+ start:13550 stop:14269 length:720 start_codon:yes stop_codon:yes gene_type:complete
MDRRESLKTLLLGSLGAGLFFTAFEALPEKETAFIPSPYRNDGTWDYGRTPEEKERDEYLFAQSFLTEQEIGTIAVLCDLILPKSSTAGSAVDAGVPDFIEFIVKDMSYLQTRIRGGLMWLDNHANKLHNTRFVDLSVVQQKAILDTIAFPDKGTPETEQGINFFNEIRNLTLTGYYTSEMGYNDLGYQGNTPNVWDGVPEDVLKRHGLSYEKEWLEKCIDQNTRTDIAEWDENGNLLN